jgi:predicted dehydrogenase
MIRKEQPDIVHLVTWPNARVELMSLVSDLKVPLCTVEKPIACGVSDWLALRKLEKATSTRFAVCHQFRWYPHLIRCQQAIASGTMGEVTFLDISAGMNIAGQGTHTLNYGRSLLGRARVQSVFGSATGFSTDDTGHPAPDTTIAQLTFDNGVRGLWSSGSVSPRCGADPTTVWQHVRVAAYAERGRVNFEEFGKCEIISPIGSDITEWSGMEAWQVGNQLAQARFHQAMFYWLETGEAPGTSLDESLHEWAVVLAVYQSALERRVVEMATFSPPEDLFDRLRSELQRG